MKLDWQPAPLAKVSFLSPLILLLAAFSSFQSVPAAGQTVDEIVAKNVQAHGGAESQSPCTVCASLPSSARALSAPISARTTSATTKSARLSFRDWHRFKPMTADRLADFSVRRPQGIPNCSPGRPEEPGRGLDLDGPLVDYKSKGHKAELVGHDSVEGTDCFKNKLSMKNGDVRYYYLDADSYLRTKSRSANHHPRRASGVRALLRRLRASEWSLLSVRGRASAQG